MTGHVEVAGWTGAARATADGSIALAFRVDGVPAPAGGRWLAVAEIDSVLDVDGARSVRAALANLAPGVAAP